LEAALGEGAAPLGIADIIMEEFDEDEQLARFLEFLVLHQLEVKVVPHELQEDEAAVSQHSSELHALLEVLLYG
jgi:hypothetical protein